MMENPNRVVNNMVDGSSCRMHAKSLFRISSWYCLGAKR